MPHDLVVATLVAEGVAPDAAALAADAAAGNLDRARLLAADPGLAARRDAFHRLPTRLDGTGATVMAATDELLGLIDGAAEPLKQRHAAEAGRAGPPRRPVRRAPRRPQGASRTATSGSCAATAPTS